EGFERARPRAEGAPAGFERDGGGPALGGSGLGDLDVDGDGRHLLQNVAHLARPAWRAVDRGDTLQGGEEVRLEALQRLAKAVVAPGEDARVPEVVAAVDQGPRRIRIGLLHEAFDLRRRQIWVQPRT